MEENCTLLLAGPDGAAPTVQELKDQLESTKEEDKVAAMKSVVAGMLNGEQMGGVLMHVIRFACTSNHHQLKKLLMIYWECVDKRGPDGKLLPEMILVCNALRNDLMHPNEYIRGCTLRLCTKLREAEVLEPLIPSITSNLEHRHSYVRRNAVLAVFAIFKTFPNLIPDGPDLVQTALQAETDISAKRNAFLMLFHCDQDKAIDYMHSVLDQVPSTGDGFQLVVLELARKMCRTHPQDKSKYIKCIITLMDTATDTVLFECANTLVSVSNAPTAVRAAAACYTQLLRSQSDNNVKLVVLERLADLKVKHKTVMQDIVIDILRGLQSPNTDIQRRTVDLALDLVTERTVDEMVGALKKEVMKTSATPDKPSEHRQMLVQAIHQCAVRFPDVANTVVNILMDFVGDAGSAEALDVVLFAREIVETFPALRELVVSKLLMSFPDIKAAPVYRCALWIFGQYASTPAEVAEAVEAIKEGLAPLPLISEAKKGGEDEEAEENKPAAEANGVAAGPTGPVLLADGTYATQSAAALQHSSPASGGEGVGSKLRQLLLDGEHFLSTAIGNCLTKLVIRSRVEHGLDAAAMNKLTGDAMLMVVSMLRLRSLPDVNNRMDSDSAERLTLCLRAMADPTRDLSDPFLKQSRVAFERFLAESTSLQRSARGQDEAPTDEAMQALVDDQIKFRQLKGSKTIMSQLDIEDEEFSDMNRATGRDAAEENFASRLNRMVQLTGFSDPLYAEACVTVHQYDIVLDMVVVNKTSETMQNLLVELSTVGDLKLCERPQNYALAPGESQSIKTSIKVSSTETGIIFGSIVYDTSGSSHADKNCVILNDIHIDIMDYIKPSMCSDREYRQMWAEFEWENKVAVNTSFTHLLDFLTHITKLTNMTCLTPRSALEGDSTFLSANLYAKSVFDEDALLNISLEKLPQGKITGYIRIRSKTQGIALGLGDKITLKQKARPGTSA